MPNRKETIDELLKIAKKDIEDAITLFNTNSYANTLYHVQQSVEKILKVYALAIYTKLDHNKLMLRINHDSFRVVYILIEEGLPKLVNIFSKLFKTIGREDLEDAFNQKLTEIISQQTIEGKYIKSIVETKPNKLKSVYREMSMNFLRDFQQEGSIEQFVYFAENSRCYGTLITGYIELLISYFFSKLSEEYHNICIDILTSINIYIFDMSERFIPVLMLSVLTAPYEAVTRYPNETLSFSKLNKDSEIVELLPRIIKLTQNALEWIEDSINEQLFADQLMEGVLEILKEEFDFNKLKKDLIETLSSILNEKEE